MPDTAALNIINVNIDSLQAEDTQRENCNTNIDDAKIFQCQAGNSWGRRYCTNTDGSFKNTNNNSGSADNTNANTLTTYFLLWSKH